MLRYVLAAALVTCAQDLPVTRLAGGAQAPVATPVSQSPARANADQLPPMPATQIDPRDAGASLDRQNGLSLSFAEPMPIGDVLRLLVEGTPFSLAVDPDATGTFRGELKRLSIRESLTTLLTPLRLDFDIQGTIIRVMKHRAETRQFDLNVLNVQRGMTRTEAHGATSIGSAVNADDVFAGIAAGVQSLLSAAGRVHVDARSGIALVSDFPERLDRVALYLETLHTRSARQVRLEAVVIEVTLQDRAAIDWRVVRERLGLGGGTAASGIVADPRALRDALASQGRVLDVWAPEVTTLNNEPAMVHVSTSGATALTLTVVPQISADGFVQLSVSHAWEEHEGRRKDGMWKSTPVVRVTGSDSVVRASDGETILVAGLQRPKAAVAAAKGVSGKSGGTGTANPLVELVVLLRPTIMRTGVAVAGSR